MAWIEKLNIALVDEREVRDAPVAAAATAIYWAGDFDRLLVHVDVDVLDFEAFPNTENTWRAKGLTWTQLMAALDVLLSANNLAAITIWEFNPEHGLSDGTTLKNFSEDIVGILAAGENSVLRRPRGDYRNEWH